MADPVTAMIVIAGSTVAKIAEENSAKNAQMEAINLKSKQNELQYQQKKISNLDMMDKVLQQQEAQATTRGVDFSSPSFNAIQRDTLNVGARGLSNLDTEKSIYDSNIDVEKRNVKDSFMAEIFGDIAGAGIGFAKIGTK